jgi:hypothetical protein
VSKQQAAAINAQGIECRWCVVQPSAESIFNAAKDVVNVEKSHVLKGEID